MMKVNKLHPRHKSALVVSVFILFVLISTFFAFRPDLIGQLKDQYIAVSYDPESKKATYKMVPERPLAWTSLDEVSKSATWAVVISEDWAFYDHKGVDFNQVQKALRDHVKGERLRGASTLTQQLAKNVFLGHERSFIRKVREAGMAIVIERSLEKKRILEHYLNIVEFGEGIYGISAASNFYFNKKPAQLTAKEGAFLAMLLPSPKKYAVSYEQKKLTEYASQTIEDILGKLNQAKVLSDEQLQRELARKLPFLQKPKNTQRKAATQKSPQPSAVKRASLNDGRDYEKRYLNDPDLALAPEQEFDPSKLEEVDLDVDVEFSLE